MMICQFHNYCEIEYLPTVYPTEEEKANTRLFSEKVRKVSLGDIR